MVHMWNRWRRLWPNDEQIFDSDLWFFYLQSKDPAYQT